MICDIKHHFGCKILLLIVLLLIAVMTFML